MEEVAWIYNSDFEKRLFENRFDKIISTKMTQEFEYFIHLLEPDKTIFTSKKYTNKFIENLEKISGSSFRTTSRSIRIESWVGDYTNPEILQKLQLKENLLRFLSKENLLENQIKYISKGHLLKNGFLYKSSKSFSGMGHMLFPRDEKKIQTLLQSGEVLIEEALLNRTLDFSTLINNRQIIARYENFVDERFQYKGTLINDRFTLPKALEENYNKSLEKILEYTKEYNGIMSVDSFLYEKDGEIKLYSACELNMRKTMGYFALEFKKKYYPQSKIFKIELIKSSGRSIDLTENMVDISPGDGLFKVIVTY